MADAWETNPRCTSSSTASGFRSNGLPQPPAPPEAIQKDNAEGLLRKLVETGETRWREASYILAVMLERKRVIKNKDQVRNEDGGRMLIYEHAKSGDVFTILDPALKLAELGDVQAKVAELLEYGLNPPAADEATGEPEPIAAAVDES